MDRDHQAICTAPKLHVRVAPATVAERVGALVRDQAVDVLRADGKWVLVRAQNGLCGWVAKRHMRQAEK